MQEVVGKILFDDIAFVAAADHEFVDSVVGISLHDVPKNRPATDVDHWLGARRRFFGNSGAETTSQDDCFQAKLLKIISIGGF